MIRIKPKSTPYTLYNILYLIYTKGYKISPFQTYKAVCLVPYVYRVSPLYEHYDEALNFFATGR